MKTATFMFAAMLAVISVISMARTTDPSQTADIKTESIRVSGNCEMCKSRIEKAAQINGVNKAEWNMQTKVLKITYNPAVVTGDAIQQKIALVGHDTEKFKAGDKVYNSLPACCKYR